VRAVSVRTHWPGDGLLSIHYRVEGDLDRLQLPPPRPSHPTDGLWRHTCFEAFVKRGDTRAYLELNFSPSTEWAIYAFDDYRHGMQPRAPAHPPEIVCRRGEDVLEVDVSIRFEGLFTERERIEGLRLGLAAVLEDGQGQLSYWALAHLSERPDFHHADAFTVSLSPSPGARA
jgi:hypothetical protein